MRSATMPQTSSVPIEPKLSAASTTPTSVSVRSQCARTAGAIAGRPSRIAENAACASTPADRTVHRYLGRRAGVEVTQFLELLSVWPLAVLPGHLEHDG